MRVLFLTHYFPPEVGAAQTRLLELALHLSRRGLGVTVLTGFPNYPDGVIPAAYRGRLLQVEHLDTIRVVRSAVYPAANQGVRRRVLNHASFAASSVVAAAWAGPADAVVVETPPLFTAASGVAIARLKRASLLLNLADLWPQAAVELGALDNAAVIAGASAIERFAYRHADTIAVPTPGLHERLVARGQAPEKVVIIPHGVEPARFPLDAHAEPVRGRVVYCGTLGLGHATGTLIEAARILAETDDRFEFLIVGDGAERADLEARARALGLSNVTFAGRMPREELPALLASAELGVATQRDLPLLSDALSTKVLEYMAAGRPVVGAVTGWTAEVISKAGAGLVCSPERPRALADAIAELIADPVRARAMGLSGRRYVEAHLTREAAATRLERALNDMADRRCARPRAEARLGRARRDPTS